MSPNLFVVYYGASWCAPCKLAGPKVEEICKKYGIALTKYNFDDLAEDEQAEISKLPTIQIWENKEKKYEITANHIALFESWCQKNVRVIPNDDF
jgi:thiol-disulfide isomerase/thioredoxin